MLLSGGWVKFDKMSRETRNRFLFAIFEEGVK